MKEETILWLDNEMTQVGSQKLLQRVSKKEKAGHIPKLLKKYVERSPHATPYGGPSALGQWNVGIKVAIFIFCTFCMWGVCDQNGPANPQMLLPSPEVTRDVRCCACCLASGL